jgi:hypothetical protein
MVFLSCGYLDLLKLLFWRLSGVLWILQLICWNCYCGLLRCGVLVICFRLVLNGIWYRFYVDIGNCVDVFLVALVVLFQF